MSQIFVSYSRQDKDFVLRLVNDLRANHVDAWLDQKDIAPGERWDMAIEKALDAATHVIFVMSKASTQSQNVRDELDIAMDSGKTIMPILIEDCTPPLRTRRLQYTDFRTDYDAALKHLLNTLDEDNTLEAFSVSTLKKADAPPLPTPTAQQLTPPVVPLPTPPAEAMPAAVTADAAAHRASRLPLFVGGGLVIVLLLILGIVLLPKITGGADNPTNVPNPTERAAVALVASATLTNTTSPTLAPTEPPTVNNPSATDSRAPTKTLEPPTVAASTSVPTLTSTPACPNSLPARLKMKGRGRAALQANIKLGLQSLASYSHESRSLGYLFAGDTFSVVNGPICDSDGLAWWNVTMDRDSLRGWHAESGWLVEANAALSRYYLDPLDTSAGAMRSNLNGWPSTSAQWLDDPGRGRYAKVASGEPQLFMSQDSDDGADFDFICHISLEKAGAGGSAIALNVRAAPDPALNSYRVSLNYLPDRQNVDVVKLVNGKPLNIPITGNTSLTIGQTYELKVVAIGGSLTIYLNTVLIAQVTDTTGSTPLTSGRFGVSVTNGEAYFRDCNVYLHHN